MIVQNLKISVSPSERKEMLARFGVHTSTLYNALCFKTHSDKAKAIREYATKTLGHKAYVEEICV